MPPQTPELVDPIVIDHLEKAFAALKSKNTLSIENLHGGKPWVTDHRHWNFEAAKKATKVHLSLLRRDKADQNCQAIYQQEPDLTREGGSIPVTLTFADSLGVNVLLLPMGRGDDGAQ